MSARLPGAQAVPAQDDGLDARQLRTAFGHFATGVAVVTARAEDGRRIGMTINSLASVSLDPPLLLWSIGRTSRNYDAFTRASHFAVHVLGEHQEDLAYSFFRTDADRFEGVETRDGRHGPPLLAGCLVRFECRLAQVIDAGDHGILLGRILDVDETPGSPLLFFRGRFGKALPHDPLP